MRKSINRILIYGILYFITRAEKVSKVRGQFAIICLVSVIEWGYNKTEHMFGINSRRSTIFAEGDMLKRFRVSPSENYMPMEATRTLLCLLMEIKSCRYGIYYLSCMKEVMLFDKMYFYKRKRGPCIFQDRNPLIRGTTVR